MPEYIKTLFNPVTILLLIGLFCSIFIPKIFNLFNKQKNRLSKDKSNCPRYFITGDKHRNFKALIRFCKKNKTTVNDTMIILGDAGFNYYGGNQDEMLKKKLSKVNITLFCIHGNKENRPQNIETYVAKEFNGGVVYYEEQYPNILFAKDCEVYQFDDKSAIVVGGAHSVDKLFRIENRYQWWDDEEPNDAIKRLFEFNLNIRNNKIDYIFSHTTPLKYEPTEMFVANQKSKNKSLKRQLIPDIDKSTEVWLDSIEEKVMYTKWFCGHYHTDKSVGRLELMFNDIKELMDGGDIHA